MKEYTKKEAIQYAKELGKSVKFYWNVFGWDVYYTLEPTIATPTGRHKDFPRSFLF